MPRCIFQPAPAGSLARSRRQSHRPKQDGRAIFIDNTSATLAKLSGLDPTKIGYKKDAFMPCVRPDRAPRNRWLPPARSAPSRRRTSRPARTCHREELPGGTRQMALRSPSRQGLRSRATSASHAPFFGERGEERGRRAIAPRAPRWQVAPATAPGSWCSLDFSPTTYCESPLHAIFEPSRSSLLTGSRPAIVALRCERQNLTHTCDSGDGVC